VKDRQANGESAIFMIEIWRTEEGGGSRNSTKSNAEGKIFEGLGDHKLLKPKNLAEGNVPSQEKKKNRL